MLKLLVIAIALIVLIANYPQKSVQVGTKAINTVVTVASSSYKVGKATYNEARTQIR
jgi:competence protein ComGC